MERDRIWIHVNQILDGIETLQAQEDNLLSKGYPGYISL